LHQVAALPLRTIVAHNRRIGSPRTTSP
jgi:hypothetical protein